MAENDSLQEGIFNYDDSDDDDEFDEEYTECPNCGSLWGFEEISFQECDCCGYPDSDNDEDDDFDEDDDDFDEYEFMEERS